MTAPLQVGIETCGLAQVGAPPITTVPPRFGVCAAAPPAPETARSETAIAAARG